MNDYGATFQKATDLAGHRSRPNTNPRSSVLLRAAGIDTQVFRLDEGPAQSTGTILDALKNVPGVTVDQDGKVPLRVRTRSPS